MPIRAVSAGISAILSLAEPVLACPACRGAVDARVYGPGFASTLALVLLPVFIVILVAAVTELWFRAAPGREADA